MNRTIKEATVKRFHYESHDPLRRHLADFVAAYNFARRQRRCAGSHPTKPSAKHKQTSQHASHQTRTTKRRDQTSKSKLLRLADRQMDANRRIIAVADSSFSAIDLLDAVRSRICMVTRLRLYARLIAPAPPRPPKVIGRPSRTGSRLPTLAQRLVDPATCWQPHLVPDWYGAGERRVELASGCAVWSHPGRIVVPLRWLIVRDPAGCFRPQAFLATDTDADPADTWVSRCNVSGPIARSRARRRCCSASFRLLLCSLMAFSKPMRSSLARPSGTSRRRSPSAMPPHLFDDNYGPTRLSPCLARPARDKIPRRDPHRLIELACYAA
jgi:hypothetical protein